MSIDSMIHSIDTKLYPAIYGEVVTTVHVKLCISKGHATLRGESETCHRCGVFVCTVDGMHTTGDDLLDCEDCTQLLDTLAYDY